MHIADRALIERARAAQVLVELPVWFLLVQQVPFRLEPPVLSPQVQWVQFPPEPPALPQQELQVQFQLVLRLAPPLLLAKEPVLLPASGDTR